MKLQFRYESKRFFCSLWSFICVGQIQTYICSTSWSACALLCPSLFERWARSQLPLPGKDLPRVKLQRRFTTTDNLDFGLHIFGNLTFSQKIIPIFKVAHLMRAVHSVFEGAPASGKEHLGDDCAVNKNLISFIIIPLKRIDGPAVGWESVQSSPSWGLRTSGAAMSHKVPLFHPLEDKAIHPFWYEFKDLGHDLLL